MTPSPTGVTTPADLLRIALTDDPARPFLTLYDDATGERVELSVATFGNWVAKTAGLLRDQVGAARGARIALALPLHWQTAVYLQACWTLGLVAQPVSPGEPLDPTAYAVVTTPERVEEVQGPEVVALTLRPALLAAQGPAALPWSAVDGETDVLSHPDSFSPPRSLPGDAEGLRAADRSWTLAELAEAGGMEAERLGVAHGARLLTTLAPDSLAGIAAALLVPLAVEGSAVLCRNPDRARLPERGRVERVDVVLD